jgi:hypothetical protein
MESFETSFIRKNDNIFVQKEKEGIKTFEFVDFMSKSYKYQPNEILITPGIVITQENQIISGHLPDGTNVFHYRAPLKLHGFLFDSEKLFALDSQQNVHIYTPNETSPEIYEISRRPLGWVIIPKTKSFVYWTLISLHCYDADTCKTTHLRQHRSKIICADATTSTVVTGDEYGYICIWYVSSWKCHHYISTGRTNCKDICIDGPNHTVVVTENKCMGYCMMTGVQSFSVDIEANYISRLDCGILIGNEKHMALFHRGTCKLCFKNEHKKIVAGTNNMVYTMYNRKIIEIQLKDIEWPLECIEWIENPSLPFEKKWSSRRYMDVLAMAADIWIPKIKDWTPPKQWFRHEKLRNAIWDTVIELDMDVSYSWMFLTAHVMKKWYKKNIKAICEYIEPEEFNSKAVRLLKRIYKYFEIKNEQIQRWCWKYHDKMCLKDINIHILENDATFLDIVMEFPITPDTILCMTPSSVKLGMMCGHIAFFLRCLIKYHEKYNTPPSHHMQRIFGLIVEHVFANLKSKFMDIPLAESGSWTPLKRPMPSHVGAYVKCGRTKGIITDIEFQPETSIRWKPFNRSLESIIATAEIPEIWKYKYKNGPNTMLECALTILNTKLWCPENRLKKFRWFHTELGAFEMETMSIRVFDQAMRIIQASLTENGPELLTSTNMRIFESEEAHIETVVPVWSYYDKHLFHIIPLRLKICSEIMKNARLNIVPTYYAKELFDSIEFKTVKKEFKWRTHEKVTAVCADLDIFFMGFCSGDIVEYHSMAAKTPARHFIKHVAPVISIRTFESKMVSLCEEELVFWCLTTGNIIFSKTSAMTYVDLMGYGMTKTWVVESYDDQCIVSLWDIFAENIEKRITIPAKGRVIATDKPALIVNNTVVPIDGPTYEIENIKGNITCAVSTYSGICGGTSEGVVFMVEQHEFDILKHSCVSKESITAISDMADQMYIITGSESGVVTIWDMKTSIPLYITKLTSLPVHHIFFENMFAIVSQNTTLHLLSIVHDRCALAVNTLQQIISWSHPWKIRTLANTQSLIKPAISECIINKSGTKDAVCLLEDCTENYEDRLQWCTPDFIDILLEGQPALTKGVLKKLASFQGPRLDCVICNDSSTNDKICFIRNCQHRFHMGCMAEFIRKVPEHHQEMQYEYALSVELKCPICRKPFDSEDIIEDTFLSQIHNN